jgi:transcriptional regulator with XRE-family HTH domain
MNMMEQTFGTRIRKLRIEAGITQKRMADLMGVSPQAACKWEKDLSCPDIMSLPRLCLILKVSLDTLFAPEMERIYENEKRERYYISKAI